MGCFLDPLGCFNDGFWSLVGMVPLWGWAVAGLVLVGVVWKLAGWPGLIALGTVIGFILGRRERDDYPTDVPEKDATVPKRVKFPRRTAKRSPPMDTLTK